MISLLIKPSAHYCNLNCTYCFYHDLTKNRTACDMMSTATAEKLIDEALAASPDGVEFMFQGGEPTLIGLNFYRHFVSYVAAHKTDKQAICYGIQTNGILIDDDWATFFYTNHFLVGLSLDGYADLHNLHRKDAASKDTFKEVMRAKKLLDAHRVSYNILCVVTGAMANHAHRVYDFFQKQQINYWQFIPCLDPMGQTRGGESFSLSPKRYAKFLCDLFDDWYRDWAQSNYTSIRFFDDCVNLLVGRCPSSCAAMGKCGQYLVIESGGDAYPCDFYVLDKWFLGNIHTKSLTELMLSPKATQFRTERSISPSCQACEYFAPCRGGCKRDYVETTKEPHHYYCESLKKFFSYAMPRLAVIADAEKRY